ncbi:MAG: hypothetical protein ACE5MK_04785 [Acidobacteriota bacterium]
MATLPPPLRPAGIVTPVTEKITESLLAMTLEDSPDNAQGGRLLQESPPQPALFACQGHLMLLRREVHAAEENLELGPRAQTRAEPTAGWME